MEGIYDQSSRRVESTGGLTKDNRTMESGIPTPDFNMPYLSAFVERARA